MIILVKLEPNATFYFSESLDAFRMKRPVQFCLNLTNFIQFFLSSVSDQQRREKLRKEIARCKKEMTSAKNSSWSSSRGSGKPLSSTFEQVLDLILL